MVRLAIIVPCHNEEEALPETARCLLALLSDLQKTGEISADSALYFVDDGSRDRTWQCVEALAASKLQVHGIKPSRNCGHQNALLAGLFAAPCDVAISIDADLQDDPEAMRGMLAAHRGGADEVYGVRRRRTVDTLFKRATAEGYYWLLARLGVEIVFNHADYRLLSRRAIDTLAQYRERNLFLRGVIPKLGFDSAIIHYDRRPRLAGESKYPLKKMLAFAQEGITSFSVAPLRAIMWFGMCASILSFAGGIWTLWERLVNNVGVPGRASPLVPMFFLGGIQLLSLGVIGEYVAKIHMECKTHPHHIINCEV